MELISKTEDENDLLYLYSAVIRVVVYGVSIGAIYGTIKTRLNYIEAKLDKHNNVVERVYKLEKDQAVLDEKQEVANHRIKDLEGLSAQ